MIVLPHTHVNMLEPNENWEDGAPRAKTERSIKHHPGERLDVIQDSRTHQYEYHSHANAWRKEGEAASMAWTS
jgi:hypothetical protein